MKKNQQFIQPGTADVGAALLSGDAFFRHAQEFIAHTTSDPATSQNRAAANLGEFIASATNLALSIEIYLKALLLQSGQPAPKTHELSDLFSKLPQDFQKVVEAAYEQLRQTEVDRETAAFALHIAAPGPQTPRFGSSSATQDNSVKGVLQRGASAFVTWRYLFAHSITPDGAPLMYEFARLSFAARAIRRQFGQLQLSLGVTPAP
jgi:hypothetical protein